MFLTDKVLDHPDTGKVFLYHAVQGVIGLEHPGKNGMHAPYNEIESDAQNGDHRQKDGCNFLIDPEGHDHGKNQHGRAADQRADDHHKGVLHVIYIGRQAGDQPGRRKFVDIGKGIDLQMMKHIVPQVAGKARRGPGAAASRQCAE